MAEAAPPERCARDLSGGTAGSHAGAGAAARFARGWRIWAPALFALALLSGASAQATTYALVIGIDEYAHVPGLAGAVNDARDLAGTLRAGGAEVVLLLDADATRARILEEWSAIAGGVGAGDSVVLTYAGHGVQMPEALPGDEADGKDEVFILHGFETEGPGLGERIRDNDVAAMLRQLPREVPVLLVADSCHSGTMTRSVDPRGSLGRSRYVAVGPVTGADPLPRSAAATRSVEPADLPNVVVAYAARDDEQTPEIEIDGAWRGALSWSVARALEAQRQAGAGETLIGFRDFVVEQVRALSGTRQTPGVLFSRSLEDASARQSLAALLGGPAEPAGPAPSGDGLVPAPPPRLFVRGPDQTRAVSMAGVEIAETEETARLVWDTGQGELVDRATADVIAEVGDTVAVEQAVAKWRAVQPLLRWAPKRPLELRVEPDDRRYRLGDSMWITATRPGPAAGAETGGAFRYLMIVNLASTGEVQLIYPSDGHVAQGLDVFIDGAPERRLGPAPVTLPVGADHVLALASRTRLDGLRAEIGRLDGLREPEKLLRLFEDHAGDPAEVRVGVLPIFTQR